MYCHSNESYAAFLHGDAVCFITFFVILMNCFAKWNLRYFFPLFLNFKTLVPSVVANQLLYRGMKDESFQHCKGRSFISAGAFLTSVLCPVSHLSWRKEECPRTRKTSFLVILDCKPVKFFTKKRAFIKLETTQFPHLN